MSNFRTDGSYKYYSRYDEIRRNKDAYEGGLARYDMFSERMVNPNSPDAIGKRYFMPSEDFSIIVGKRVDVAPTSFTLMGDMEENKLFLKKKLWEFSNIESKLPRSYREQDLAGDSFWEIKLLSASKEEKHMFSFGVNQLESENVEPNVNPITGLLNSITIREVKNVVTPDGSTYKYDIKKTYYEKEIVTEYLNLDASMMQRLFKMNRTKETIKNPFYGTGFLGVLWFKGEERGDSFTSICPATKLIEPQLQLDKNWTQHEMAIHRGIFPIVEFLKASRSDYSKTYLGAGAIIASHGEQQMKIHAPQVMITEMLAHIKQKEDKIYFLAGVLPPSVEQKIFATDSMGVAKFASKQLITTIETRLQSYKDEMSKLFKAFLLLNGKKYNQETIKLPDDVLKVDLEKASSIYGILMNLGIVDDEFVWSELFPDFQQKDKDRIRDAFEKKQIDTSKLNMDNKLKTPVAQTKGVGNKAKNTKDTDGKVVSDG